MYIKLNISEGAALRQERSPRRGARRAGAINYLQFIKKNIVYNVLLN